MEVEFIDDFGLRIFYVNEVFIKIIGYIVEEMLGKIF